TIGVVLAIIGCILHWGGNLVFQLLSAALSNIGSSQIGSSTPLSFSDLQKVLGTWSVYVSYAGIALLAVGLFLVATGIIGAIGACCNSKLLIIVYIVIMAVLALACAGLAAGYIINKNLMRTEGAKQMTTLVKSEYKGRGSANEFTNILDLIQARVPCCGVDNYTIYHEFNTWNSTYQLKNGTYIDEVLPESCCKISGATFEPTYENCTYSPDSQNSNMYEGGCYTKLAA
uniref:Tetraspanin n=1 Tax=Macrostomum lignano TaxID=282301 RepID=A0A1I8IRB2_9PLAT